MNIYQSTPDFYNDYIAHFNKNHDPKNGQFTTGSGGYAKPNKQFEKEYKDILNSAKTDEEKDIRIRELDKKYTNPNIKITRDNKYGMLEASVKNGSKDITIHCFEDEVNETELRDAIKEFSKNKASIEKQAKDVIMNDDSQYSIYKLYAERNGISKKKFKDSLELKSVFVYDNNGNAEVSLWEKDNVKENLTGGHSLDIEVNLKTKKMDKHYSMNG